jgi:hypothetical protein
LVRSKGERAVAGDAPLEREAGRVDHVEDAGAAQLRRDVLQRLERPGVEHDRSVQPRQLARARVRPGQRRGVAELLVEERPERRQRRELGQRRDPHAPVVHRDGSEQGRELRGLDEAPEGVGRLRHDREEVDVGLAGQAREQLERAGRARLGRHREDPGDHRHHGRSRSAAVRSQSPIPPAAATLAARPEQVKRTSRCDHG